MQVLSSLLLAVATGTFAASPPANEGTPLQLTSATRAKAYVQVQNKLPVNASFELYHFRGLDYSGTIESNAWHNVQAGEHTRLWEVSYEKGELVAASQ